MLRVFAASRHSQKIFRTANVAVVRSFAASAVTCSPVTATGSLSGKLMEELKFESEAIETALPSFLVEFKDRAPFWKIEDHAGEKEVCLTREFQNEKIRVLFSIDALNERSEEEDDMDFEGEDSAVEPEETEAEGDSDSFPVNMTVIIEKAGGPDGTPDAMEISAQLTDETFFIDNVSYDGSAKLMLDDSADADWARRGHFDGPVFADLDEGLQDEFHSYLQARGFDKELAAFVPQYIEMKEQKEYCSWLKNVAAFVKRG